MKLEFVDTFLKLADVSIILNIDEDHLDYFKTLDNIIASFRKFCNNTSKAIIVNGDDVNSMKAVEGITGKDIITFGFADTNDYYPVIKKLLECKLILSFIIRIKSFAICQFMFWKA